MRQNWEKLLFLHWPIDPALIRPRVPAGLQIDTCEGKAWISVTPFTLTGLRPILIPPILGLRAFHELNVRTYVVHEGVPGIWFFTLYASKTLPTIGGRLLFSLPYRTANIRCQRSADRMHYALRRTGSHPADFEAQWWIQEPLPPPDPESLAFFLAERYCLYAAQGDRLFRCRVQHVPWQLRAANLSSLRSNLLLAEGLPEPTEPPLVHYGGDQRVEVWPLEHL